jgi:hypothetical protein
VGYRSRQRPLKSDRRSALEQGGYLGAGEAAAPCSPDRIPPRREYGIARPSCSLVASGSRCADHRYRHQRAQSKARGGAGRRQLHHDTLTPGPRPHRAEGAIQARRDQRPSARRAQPARWVANRPCVSPGYALADHPRGQGHTHQSSRCKQVALPSSAASFCTGPSNLPAGSHCGRLSSCRLAWPRRRAVRGSMRGQGRTMVTVSKPRCWWGSRAPPSPLHAESHLPAKLLANPAPGQRHCGPELLPSGRAASSRWTVREKGSARSPGGKPERANLGARWRSR